MTELDLQLKAISRRLLWRMGYSTRIDVPLRAIGEPAASQRGRSSAPESFTDLDVLGVAVSSGAAVRTSIVDCKTGGSSAITRMFWVRGLQDFFEADDAFLVRERPISKGARQLASRLGLTALTGEEVATLEGLHPVDLPLDDGPLSALFDPKAIAKAMERLTNLDTKLKPLMDYRQFDYWVYPEHLNLMRMVEVLRAARDFLDARNPIHTGIVLDCAWLYVLSIAHAVQFLRAVHISDLSGGLSEYLAGGPSQLRQKREVGEVLTRLQEDKLIPSSVNVSVNPAYFASLLELLTRLLRRNDFMTPILRHLEFETAMALGADRVTAADGLGAGYDKIAAKLALDVVAFLVTTSEIDPGFIASARTLLGNSGGPAPMDDAPKDAPTLFGPITPQG